MSICMKEIWPRAPTDGMPRLLAFNTLNFVTVVVSTRGSRLMSEALVEAVRGLWLADPGLGVRSLLAKLREQQPDLGAATREVREALIALKIESEAAKAAATQPAADEGVPPAANEGDAPAAADEGVPPAADKGGAPPNVAVSLACVGCGRLPSEMDDEREKHAVCRKCVKLKLPTTY
eukprot:scaffold123099_cov36-Phaeocystis_antarctica.AAC.1